MAAAALEDQAYMRATCAETIALRDVVADTLDQLGYNVIPSFTNFVLIDLGQTATANKIDNALKVKNIFLRPQGGAGLPYCLRFTIGPANHNAAALAVFETVKPKALP